MSKLRGEKRKRRARGNEELQEKEQNHDASDERFSYRGTLERLAKLWRGGGTRRVNARRFANCEVGITDGPFTEAKEVAGDCWMIQVKSREGAFEWASRIPGKDSEMVEVRRVLR